MARCRPPRLAPADEARGDGPPRESDDSSALFSAKHTVRGFVSILGSKGGQKIESTKNASGERSYRIAK